MVINLRTLMSLRLIMDKQGLVDVQTSLYQKQKLKRLVEKLFYGTERSVLQEMLTELITHTVQEVLMSI